MFLRRAPGRRWSVARRDSAPRAFAARARAFDPAAPARSGRPPLDRQSATDSMPRMSQKKWFAMAAIGRDRPGIVADLSECIYACGCNLEDASMTMLGSEFATLML